MSADLDFEIPAGGIDGPLGPDEDELPPMTVEPRGPRPPVWRDPWFIAGGLFTVGVVVYLTTRPPRDCADCAERKRIEAAQAKAAGYDAERASKASPPPPAGAVPLAPLTPPPVVSVNNGGPATLLEGLVGPDGEPLLVGDDENVIG